MAAAANAQGRRVNEEIRVPRVNLIGPEGQNLGVRETKIARALAYEMGLDLVEVNPNVRPPVVKMTDYSKVRYAEQQKAKQARKTAKAQELKELKFRPTTDEHDLDVKLKQAEKFLSKGNKLKLTVQMRGRERGRAGSAVEVLEKIAGKLAGKARIIQSPSVEGRLATMVLAPVQTDPNQR